MPLPNDVRTSYEVVLRDLESERTDVQQQLAGLQSRLKDLHNSISTLTKRLDQDDAFPSRPQIVSRPPKDKYAHMSVRWAILDLLNDSAAMTTSEIAEALLAAGVQTKAA